MNIAIDFDGTFGADPMMFRAIVRIMRAYGHTPIMVTQRCAKHEEEIQSIVKLPHLPIIFASGQTKEAAARAAGYEVAIWIDDNPESVVTALRYKDCP